MKAALRALGAAALLAHVASGCVRGSAAAPAKVFKHDGSVQCQGKGTPVEDMARELAGRGIGVICGQKGSDGMMHCAACGCGTGRLNVYTIEAASVPDAERLGFAPVSALPAYRDTPCRD